MGLTRVKNSSAVSAHRKLNRIHVVVSQQGEGDACIAQFPNERHGPDRLGTTIDVVANKDKAATFRMGPAVWTMAISKGAE